jgi:hypothetical protein
MKHVRLPIYDDAGMELNEHLEVSVEILQRLAATSVIYKDHVKIVQSPTPEQELEVLDRIVHGLPPKPAGFWESIADFKRPPSAHFTLGRDGTLTQNVKPEEVEFVDIVSKYPKDWEEAIDYNRVALRVDKWRPIPGYSKYEMSTYKAIAEKATGKSVSIVKGGRFDNALLSNDDGVNKRVHIDFLFKKTFPEL